MTLELITAIALALAGIPALMVAMNLLLLRRPRSRAEQGRRPAISVLVPARNEERSIRSAVEAALASRGVDVEVVVMDDQSDDGTARIVRDLASLDARVRLESAPPLPDGWCGKQFACQQLANRSRHPLLVFVDADVRLAPDALRDMAGFMDRSGAGLISGVPRQITASFGERLVVPLVHFVLLGFLPMIGMRLSRRLAFAAGCGQLFMARRDAYDRAGGHESIRESRHDGIRLPRAFRAAGLKTDLFDATRSATCRMYRNGAEVWQGFAKNATEGMAAPGAILPWTILLGGGQILPWLLLIPSIAVGGSASTLAVSGAALGMATRLALTLRFRQSWIGALLHPFGVAMVLAIQWYALAGKIRGREVAWKGRTPETLAMLLVALASAGLLADTIEPPRVTFVIDGLRSNKGSVAYAVFDSEQAYDERTAPVQAGFVPIDKKQCSISLEGLPPGIYAAAFYHDRNGNGELDRNVLGAPSEPYTFSNDARGRFGPPPFAEARFELSTPEATLQVRVK